MRFIIFLGSCMVLLCSSVQAETMYVNDNMKITLRTGPGIERKILSMLKMGQEVEVIQPDDQWSQVKLPNGTEGWVLSRFLTSDKPCYLELEILRQKNKALTSQSDVLFEENKVYKKQSKRLVIELSEAKEMLAKITESYNILKNDSEGFLELKSEYEQISMQFAEQTEREGKTEARLSKLLLHNNIIWFLSGAGVLLVGILIGVSARRQRRKSSLL